MGDSRGRPDRAVQIPRWVSALIWLSALKCLVGIAGAAVLSSTQPVRGLIFGGHVLAFCASGLMLIVMRAADQRALWLGVYFLLVATTFADTLVLLLARGWPGQNALQVLASIQIAALQPYFFWRFAREFPRVTDILGDQAVANGFRRAAAVTAWLLIIVNVLVPLVPNWNVAGFLRAFDRFDDDSVFWLYVVILSVPALPYLVWNSRRALADERRRVRLLVSAIGAGMTPMLLYVIAEGLSPAFYEYSGTPRGMLISTFVVHPPLMSVPFTTAYAVLVHRALQVRLIVRRALQYALARSTLIIAIVLPFAGTIALLYARRDQRLADAWSGSAGIFGLVLASAGVAGLTFRRTLLDVLDRRFFREQYDARAILGALVERSLALRNADEISRVVPAEIDRALHVTAASLWYLDESAAALVAPGHSASPLPATSPILQRLGRSAEMLDLEWSEQEGWIRELPIDDQTWLVDTDARLLVGITGRNGALIAVIALGEKSSELPYSSEDRRLLQSICAAVALPLETAIAATSRPPTAVLRPLPLGECVDCGQLAERIADRCTTCGGRLETAAVPSLVAGKYRPTQRIGRGGMGIVYRAVDLTLGRSVALKTLPHIAPAAVARLRREARAMAVVSHPNLAVIYAAEAWHGAPILVVELLSGGTLQDRLAQGPMPPVAALSLVAELAPALDRLHSAGILHRDIKPSNIAFGEDGTPKLLDFGLARVVEWNERAEAGDFLDSPTSKNDSPAATLTATGEILGTPLYLSPELLRGGKPSAASDLWALTLVLYESITGVHPLDAVTIRTLFHNIANSSIRDVRELAPDTPESVALFIGECLHSDPGLRPASAREWERRVRLLLRDMRTVPSS